jgi:hypothetical protein
MSESSNNSQFRESATEERADTAYDSSEIGQRLIYKHTLGGETSGIITKGRGPMPMANDLGDVSNSRKTWAGHLHNERQDCDTRQSY